MESCICTGESLGKGKRRFASQKAWGSAVVNQSDANLVVWLPPAAQREEAAPKPPPPPDVKGKKRKDEYYLAEVRH